MPRKQAMFKHALQQMNNNKNMQMGNMPGRAVGRNPTPGIPRRVGPQDRFHPARAANKQPLQGRPRIIQRDPLNDYQGHNLPLHNGIAPGEPDPNSGPPIVPRPDGNPSGNPDPRPMGTLGMRRLSRLGDKNTGNDKRGLEVLMRLFGRAQAGKNFGGKAFGARAGNNMDDFFAATDQYTKGTGYRRMLRQAAGLPVRPRTKNYPGKPRGNPSGPYMTK